MGGEKVVKASFDAGEEIVKVEGETIDPKGVRQIATQMGIPAATSLPEVIVVGQGQDEYYQEGPQINKSEYSKSPSGFFITIPERMVKKIDESSYTLGSRAREDLRHELAHYEDYLRGGHVGREEDPYKTALKEVRAELRTHPRSMSLCLARHASRLVEEYDLSAEESLKLMERAARELGVSPQTIGRMYRLCEAE